MRWAAAALVTALLLQAYPAAAYSWPWDAPVRRHRHHIRIPTPVAPAEIPSDAPIPDNCDRINDAVKTLTPKNLKRALDDSNKKQRSTIDDCSRKGEAGR